MSKSDALSQSWRQNADVWTDAVRNHRIASRAAGTDAAILQAATAGHPTRILDLGCGEGWLCRALRGRAESEIVGIDASPDLVRHAQDADPDGTYLIYSYAQLAADPHLAPGPFDLVLFNFALLDQDLAMPLQVARARLADQGVVLIQTLHPWHACERDLYASGWQQEAFSTFASGGWRPMPWYFHTLRDWFAVLTAAGFEIRAMASPRHAESGTALSLLLSCQLSTRPL